MKKKQKKTKFKIKFKIKKLNFEKCPRCQCNDLLHIGVDFICTSCDWHSAQSYVDVGNMDNLFAAHLDHFFSDYSEIGEEKVKNIKKAS